MTFEILGEISQAETIATSSSIREIARLRKIYGPGRWRKRKGIARVRLPDGSTSVAEVHWYEASGIGDGAGEDHRVLRYERDVAAQILRREIGDVDAVEADRPRPRREFKIKDVF